MNNNKLSECDNEHYYEFHLDRLLEIVSPNELKKHGLKSKITLG
jgi:hypothetical protein